MKRNTANEFQMAQEAYELLVDVLNRIELIPVEEWEKMDSMSRDLYQSVAKATEALNEVM